MDGGMAGSITVAQPLKGFHKFLNMLELWVLIKIIICMLKIYWFCGGGDLVSWMLFASCIFTQEFLMGVPISSSKEEPSSISDQEQDLGATGLISTSQNCPKADHWRRYKMLKFAQNFFKAKRHLSSLFSVKIISSFLLPWLPGGSNPKEGYAKQLGSYC